MSKHSIQRSRKATNKALSVFKKAYNKLEQVIKQLHEERSKVLREISDLEKETSELRDYDVDLLNEIHSVSDR